MRTGGGDGDSDRRRQRKKERPEKGWTRNPSPGSRQTRGSCRWFCAPWFSLCSPSRNLVPSLIWALSSPPPRPPPPNTLRKPPFLSASSQHGVGKELISVRTFLFRGATALEPLNPSPTGAGPGQAQGERPGRAEEGGSRSAPRHPRRRPWRTVAPQDATTPGSQGPPPAGPQDVFWTEPSWLWFPLVLFFPKALVGQGRPRGWCGRSRSGPAGRAGGGGCGRRCQELTPVLQRSTAARVPAGPSDLLVNECDHAAPVAQTREGSKAGKGGGGSCRRCRPRFGRCRPSGPTPR